MKNDLRAGMYIRTDEGIRKILEEFEEGYLLDRSLHYLYPEGHDLYKSDLEDAPDDIVIKASDKLIYLIEVGDYVNGKKVIKKWEELFGEFAGQTFIKLEGEETIPTLRKIEKIVTKEQFEQMSYKVGD